MCLSTISCEKPKLTGYGWKSFYRLKNGQLVGTSRGNSKRRLIGRWLKENDFAKEDSAKTILSGMKGFRIYPRGWHIWVGISSHYGRLVKYRKAKVLGKQEGYNVVVAKEIFIYPKRDVKKIVKKINFYSY